MDTESQKIVIGLIKKNVLDGMSALNEKMKEIESADDRESLLMIKARLALLVTISMDLLDPLMETYTLIEKNDGMLTADFLHKMRTDMEARFIKGVMKGFEYP